MIIMMIIIVFGFRVDIEAGCAFNQGRPHPASLGYSASLSGKRRGSAGKEKGFPERRRRRAAQVIAEEQAPLDAA